MVRSVAAFAEEDVRKSVVMSDRIRKETLDRCYSLDGYKNLPREEKNKVYDRVKKEVEKELGA